MDVGLGVHAPSPTNPQCPPQIPPPHTKKKIMLYLKQNVQDGGLGAHAPSPTNPH